MFCLVVWFVLGGRDLGELRFFVVYIYMQKQEDYYADES